MFEDFRMETSEPKTDKFICMHIYIYKNQIKRVISNKKTFLILSQIFRLFYTTVDSEKTRK